MAVSSASSAAIVPGPIPAACRVERIGAKTLDGGDAQSVNRGLGENEPWEGFEPMGASGGDLAPPVSEPL